MSRARGRCRAAAAVLALATALSAHATTVRDDLGQTVSVAQPARRIVALSPQLAELALAAGAGSALVATVQGDFQDPRLQALPRVGDAFAINLEALAALHPDLILAWSSGTPPRQRAALQNLGAPVFWSETARIEQVGADVRRLGQLAGSMATASAWASGFDARLQRLRAAHAGKPPLPVFVQLWPHPLITAGGPQLFTQALQVCGARNVFDDLEPASATVAREAVLQRRPMLIVAADPDPHALDAWAGWPAPRVRLNPDLLPRMGLRVLDGVAQLCAAVDAARSTRAQRATQ